MSIDNASGEMAAVAKAGEGKHSGDGLDCTDPRGKAWMELLKDGLTFDLCGLAPGELVSFPEPVSPFDLPDLPLPRDYDAIQLMPGHHLAGGERSLPVAKSLFGIARDLVREFDEVQAIVWPPSGSAIGPRFFESVITAWIEGGPFPALGLTSFSETGEGSLQSVGLDFWIGQELLIEPPLSNEKVAATRLGVRLINQMIMVGGIDRDERIMAPDGSRLILRLARNGRYIRVLHE